MEVYHSIRSKELFWYTRHKHTEKQVPAAELLLDQLGVVPVPEVPFRSRGSLDLAALCRTVTCRNKISALNI